MITVKSLISKFEQLSQSNPQSNSHSSHSNASNQSDKSVSVKSKSKAKPASSTPAAAPGAAPAPKTAAASASSMPIVPPVSSTLKSTGPKSVSSASAGPAAASSAPLSAGPSAPISAQPAASASSLSLDTVPASADPAKKPKSTLQSQPRNLVTLTGTFLDAMSLSSTSNTCPLFTTLYRSPMADNKKASELLEYVVNADPEKIKYFLTQAQPKMGRLLLTKTCGKEGYYKKIKTIDGTCKESGKFIYKTKFKYICKRMWNNVSPIEAAALTGDHFILIDLLNKLPVNLRNQAADQLEGILNSAKEILNSEDSTIKAQTLSERDIKNSDKKVNMEKNGIVERKRIMEVKETQERKSMAEKVQVKVPVVENQPYLEPYRKVIKAYGDYFKVLKKFRSMDKKDSDYQKTLDQVTQCWEKIGDAQKELPTYGLQAFMYPRWKNKGFGVSTIDLKVPPFQRKLLHMRGPMDLDLIGTGTKSIIYGGGNETTGIISIESPIIELANYTGFDEINFQNLCLTRTVELELFVRFLRNPALNDKPLMWSCNDGLYAGQSNPKCF